ncbi:hypothetical protein [Nannocystis punicea]|uniref:Uncharacterized protein n=1 Tax=Nannocystis punicea TaxID=2995304 RepID=A0ABY7GUA5_9BACT|nr:hypothetical protein [Nannocystis poenicansa]WAS90503.1 hypothetical protein O0S08_30310 [Nannocystis poenicansa]
MSLFGGKEIAALQSQLGEVRAELAVVQGRSRELEAELAALRSSRDEALRRVYELQAELARAEERAGTCAARLDRLRAGARAPVTTPSTSPPTWEVVDDAEPDDRVVRGRYEIEGRERLLHAFERMLQIVASAGQIGASVVVEVLVDGDGAGQLVVRRDGQSLRLSETEARAWLLGQEDALAAVEDIRRDGALCVELA